MWCANCKKEVVFGKPGPTAKRLAQEGKIILGGTTIPAPCPVCGHPLDWARVLPKKGEKHQSNGKSPRRGP